MKGADNKVYDIKKYKKFKKKKWLKKYVEDIQKEAEETRKRWAKEAPDDREE